MILVTSSRLGTINHTFLTLKFAEQLRLNVKGIVFNGYEGTCSEDDNIKTIEEITKVPVLATIQRIQNVDTETMQDGLIREVFEKNMDIKKILENMEEIFHE
jgi:dethiobiotin synthetase